MFEMVPLLEVQMMVHPRFLQLVIGARRQSTASSGPAGRRQGSPLTQFSFRLAFAIDLAYVGLGALGGAAMNQAARGSAQAPPASAAVVAPWCAPTPAGVIR